MDIRLDDLTGDDVAKLLGEHLQDMYATSPADSVHALDLSKLRQPHIDFWTIWENNQLAGCGAINRYSVEDVEIKSMRVSNAFRRRGVAATLLTFMLNEAKARGAKTVNLETGSMDFFIPARTLYARHGFIECGPFADYKADANSVFMTLSL
ncbi:GNAT family N-acetyltransferase [Shewanella sp. 10N.7]|uniref:GNAT family N-acetyltransferase n=1 Tax=Shewanella sp. 10N.7 TaxID=2885093 RepID=UPI001E5FD220|nr:GNAT family N-acetyltransferase [Shewanella sp. 10N.7]MCC4834762.1 GNAT family N-acetyltransferase [Shewanella sp. 10N.7]